jgi:hypothetical protein
MIATIIILTIAFAYLGYETKWLTIRLPVGKNIDLDDTNDDYGYVKANNDYLTRRMNNGKDVNNNPNPPITNPVIFTPLDMPELQGTINIGYKRV